ncbi:MAG: HlyC/CorC family transporter [Planctomycetes bacterium]|nr:HlyC/CorC family transporter [Planctomycetota bacterium]
MNADATFWLAMAGLVVTCMAAMGARSLVVYSRAELAEVCRRHKTQHILREILLRDEEVSLAAETLQVLATALVVAAGSLWLYQEIGPEDPNPGLLLAGAILAGGLLLLVVEIWLPRTLAGLWAAPFLYHTWGLWKLVARLLFPLVWSGRAIDSFMRQLVGRPREKLSEEAFEEEIIALVTEGQREGLLEEEAREMIQGVMQLGDVNVSQIMTPRIDMVSMPLGMEWSEMLAFVIGCGHTRIPVYGKSRDDIVGVLNIRDLFPELAKSGDTPTRPLQELLRQPFFVPETKPVNALLQEFQLIRNHMAIVLDEYGGVCGLVTIEDVLEEIVGEIVDEYDEALIEGIRQLDETTAEALARIHIDEINERLGLELSEAGEYDTIGGLVFHELGHLPAVGESVQVNNVRLTVIDATRRRIERIRIEVLNPSPPETV